MKFLFILLALLIVPARAEVKNYHTDVKICPSVVYDGAEYSFTFIGWNGIIPQAEQPADPTSVQSTWSPLTCEIEGNALTIMVSLPVEAYPIEQVPDTATCTATDTKGNTHYLRVHPVLMQASDLACLPRDGVWYSETSVIYSATDTGGITSRPLLSGHQFADGVYQARLNDGTTWTGVSCTVKNNGRQMAVSYAPTSTEGIGYCSVPDGNSTARVPIELDRFE